jgi:hypothetical protein
MGNGKILAFQLMKEIMAKMAKVDRYTKYRGGVRVSIALK